LVARRAVQCHSRSQCTSWPSMSSPSPNRARTILRPAVLYVTPIHKIILIRYFLKKKKGIFVSKLHTFFSELTGRKMDQWWSNNVRSIHSQIIMTYWHKLMHFCAPFLLMCSFPVPVDCQT
jgi:hypothetical protein